MAKKAEGTPHHPLLEIHIAKRQETGSPLAIAVPASPAIADSPLPAPTPAPQSAVQTIEQLVKADPEHYQTKKMQLPRHDPSNEASVEAAGWCAQHAMMHWTACDDPTCVIHRSSHEYRKSFKDWNYCQYYNNHEYYTGSCPVKLHDDTYTESPKLLHNTCSLAYQVGFCKLKVYLTHQISPSVFQLLLRSLLLLLGLLCRPSISIMTPLLLLKQ